MPEGRVPPQSIEAELSVLGAMMLKKDAVTQATELLRADEFYRQAHRVVFEAMEGLVREGEPVDIVTVTEALKKSGLLEQVGGITFLANLTNSVPSTANLANYAKIVKEKAILRALIDVSTEIAGAAYEGSEDIAAQLDSAEHKVLAIASGRTTGAFTPIKDVVFDAVDRISALSKAKGGITGLSTGLASLDARTAEIRSHHRCGTPCDGQDGIRPQPCNACRTPGWDGCVLLPRDAARAVDAPHFLCGGANRRDTSCAWRVG